MQYLSLTSEPESKRPPFPPPPRFQSDVLEVFIAPVHDPTDNPQWYFELDASPSGVMWAGLSNNSRGNVSTCVSADACAAAGTLPCSGRATFPFNMTVAATNGTGTRGE